MKKFDLNSQKVLSDWTIVSALREIIANALDEQKLSNSEDITINNPGADEWHIIDYGRGLSFEHLTLNENQEKLKAEVPLIGKFGFGLKDALATLHRKGVEVEIHSSKGTFRLVMASKHDFPKTITLQVDYDSTSCIEVGTEVRLTGVRSSQIEEAKGLFLELSGHTVIETNSLGQVIDPDGDTPGVYIHGSRVNDEPDFRFSYNISKLDPQLSRFLNREKQAVSKSAYGSVLGELVLECESELVRDPLAAELEGRHGPRCCREVKSWTKVGVFALERLGELKSVVAVSKDEFEYAREHIDNMRAEKTVPVLMRPPELTRIKKLQAEGKTKIRLLRDWVKQDQEKYILDPVPESEMSEPEKTVFATRIRLMRLVGVQKNNEPKIIVSNTTRPPQDAGEVGDDAVIGITTNQVVGYYSPAEDLVVIHRNQLMRQSWFAGTLLHELAHRSSRRPDVDRGFEIELTRFLGLVGARAVQRDR